MRVWLGHLALMLGILSNMHSINAQCDALYDRCNQRCDEKHPYKKRCYAKCEHQFNVCEAHHHDRVVVAPPPPVVVAPPPVIMEPFWGWGEWGHYRGWHHHHRW